MFTIILIVGALLIVALVVLVNMQPASFCYTRSRSIPAPASVLFEQVDVLQNWGTWSPFDRADPQSKRRFPGRLLASAPLARGRGRSPAQVA